MNEFEKVYELYKSNPEFVENLLTFLETLQAERQGQKQSVALHYQEMLLDTINSLNQRQEY